jgi:signal transduction histidine kinase
MIYKKSIAWIWFLQLSFVLHAQQKYFLSKVEKTPYTQDVNIVSDLCIDTNHSIIVATPNRVFAYNGLTSKEINLPQSQKILNISKNVEQKVFITSTSGSIYSINPNNYEAKPIIQKRNLNSNDRFLNYTFLHGPEKFFKSIQQDKSLSFSFFETHAIYIASQKSFFVRWFRDSNYFWLHSNLKKSPYARKKEGKYYYHNQTLIIRNKNNQFTDLINPYSSFDLPPTIKNKNNFYLVHKPNQALSLVYGEQIWILKEHLKKYEWELITQEFPKNTSVTCLAYDSLLNQYYIGTQTEGLFILKERNFEILKSNNDNLQSNYYLQLPLTQNMIVSNGGKIAHPSDHAIEINTPLIDYHINNNVFPLSAVEYLGHTNEHFIRFHLKNNTHTILSPPLSLGGTNYYPLSSDSLLVISKDSFYYFEIKKNLFTTIAPNKKSHLNIYKIVKIANLIWIASCSGIDIFDLNTHKFTHKLFEDICIRELFETPQGILVSCYGIGLKLVNTQNLSIQNIPLDTRKSLRYTHAVISQKNKTLIIPTNNGLLFIKTETLLGSKNKNKLVSEPDYFDEFDGLPTNEFNGGAHPKYLNWGDSLLSLVSLKGIVQFNPKNLNSHSFHPIFNFNIQEIQKNNKTTKFSNNLVHTTTFTEEIRIKVDFTYWGNPSNLPLFYTYLNKEYKIPINSTKNIPVLLNHYGYEKLVFYSKINQIKKPLATLIVYRNPLWYKQFHIWLVIIMFIWGLFFLYDRIRVVLAELKTEKLEHIITAKTEELNTINRTLNFKLIELQNANDHNEFYVSVINHDIFAPIKYINLMGKELTQNFQAYSKTEIVAYLNAIINSTQRLEILCSNILNHLIPHTDWQFQREPILLNNLLNELEEFIFLGLKIQKNEFICEVPDNLYIDTNKDALHIILINLLSNSNRFTQHGLIKIFYHFNKHAQEHELVISDTGRGISEELQDKINQRELAISHKNNIDSQSYGIGYNLIFKMLSLIKGRLEIQQGSPRGTVVTLYLPK